MRIVIAPDSFKECASSEAVASALAEGWRRIYPEAECDLVPMADGGEGTVDALLAATQGERVTLSVTGPLNEPVSASYGLIHDRQTAVIEMAAVAGLALVSTEQRDPCRTTTYGVGELINDALNRGVRKILLGLGGSATNDGGAGMAQALGYALCDTHGQTLPRGGAALAALDRIDPAKRLAALDHCEIVAACDVDNPLCGPQGASQVYGPQKGASETDVTQLDTALRHFAGIIQRDLGVTVLDTPGAGAAGGLGAGLLAFAGASIQRGIALVIEATRLEERIQQADLVLTGEGRIDGQTASGKTPFGVAQLARRANVPVIVFGGSLAPGYEALYASGIDVLMPICPGPVVLSEALMNGEHYLADAAERAARIWRAAREGKRNS